MKYSIVVPVHNEERNLRFQIEEFLRTLSDVLPELEPDIILVENGSTDGTLDIALELQCRYQNIVRVLSLERGSYGRAIREGMLAAKGRYLSILECDLLSVDFLVVSFSLFLGGNARLIIASKRHPESRDCRPRQRIILTHMFNRLLTLCTSYPGTDTHGLKSVETLLAQELCKLCLTTDEVLQTEFVLIAWKRGIPVIEVPINLKELRAAPVSVRRRIPKVVSLVVELRRSLLRFTNQRPGNIVSYSPRTNSFSDLSMF